MSYHDEPITDAGPKSDAAVQTGDYNDLTDTNVAIGFITVAILYTGFLAGVFFVICEKYNRYIRFWAWQTIMVDAIWFLIYVILTIGMWSSNYPRDWCVAIVFCFVLRFRAARRMLLYFCLVVVVVIIFCRLAYRLSLS